MISLHQKNADRHVPDGLSEAAALSRTTHLGIVAHQDDLEILAFHGISECFENPKQWFTGVVVGDGAGSPRSGAYAAHSDQQMVDVRRLEQRRAADLGKYSAVFQLNYSSPEIKSSGVGQGLASPMGLVGSAGLVGPASSAGRTSPISKDLSSLLSAAPSVKTVYLHNPADSHDTHVAVFSRSIDALRALPVERRPTAVWGCEVWRDLDWLPSEKKVGLPVSRRPDLAEKLCQVFDSQTSGGKRYDLAVLARRRAHATFSASHETDQETGLTLAVDLMPLLLNPRMKIADFTLSLIEEFKNDVKMRLEKF